MNHACGLVFASSLVSGLVSCLASSLLIATATAEDLRMQCGRTPRTFVEKIDTGGKSSSTSHSYSIHMNGKLDGEMTRDPIGYWAYDQFWEPNVEVRLENLGDTPLVHPWIQRAGAPDTRSLKSIVASIVRPEMSDEEKARRLWEYEIHSRFHATTQDEEVADVVKRVNVYGYTLCYDESKALSDLWRAAGLKVRQGFPNGHSLAEVYYNGGWHLLDSDESIISLLRDNETIASEAQVVADHDLMKRTHTYGPLANDSRMTDETSAALLSWEGERTGEQPSLTRHNMDFTLRPGESIAWAWNPANRYHAKPFSFGDEDGDKWNKRWRVIAHVMDGDMTYDPDLGKPSTLEYLHVDGVESRTSGRFGKGLYLTAGTSASPGVGTTGVVDVPVTSAYPVVGGRLEVDFARLDFDAEQMAISISFDQGKSWKEAWTSVSSDYNRMYVDLDPFFQKTDDARYGYLLRFTLRSHAANPAVALKAFYLRSTLQMAPLAMPGVALGLNQFVYSDGTSGAKKIRITHSWNECEAEIAFPGAPVAVTPADGKISSGTRVKFAWKSASGKNADDYEFELGEFADMRWALSSNFHKLISRTANRGTPSFELPYNGLLNPGKTYYWRVRGRSEDGVWGPWSKTFSFSAAAPAVPLEATASFDRDRRVVQLKWIEGQGGTTPARYRIYGSQERGFSANDSGYPYHAGLDGIQQAPANLLLETQPVGGTVGQSAGESEGQSVGQSVEIPEDLWRPFYRVVAVDREGRASGASAIAELSRPLIATNRLNPAVTSHLYQARIKVSSSIGHLVSADEDGKPYQMRFRTGDDLVFAMAGAPEGLSMDNSGLISGFLTSAATGSYEVTINVKSKTTGNEDSLKLPLVVTAERP